MHCNMCDISDPTQNILWLPHARRLLLTTENTIETQGEAKPALIAIALFMVVGPRARIEKEILR